MSAPKGHLRLIAVVALLLLAGCSGAVPGDNPAEGSQPTAESPTTVANGTLEVHYINVGQSVSTLLISPNGETMLVDTGHYNDDGEFVLVYLQYHDITRIDYQRVTQKS